MPVYYIISYDITDPEDFSNYGPRVIPYLSKFGGEVLASDTDGMLLKDTQGNECYYKISF